MIVGVDIGYGYTKVVAEERQITFPSVVGKAERIRYENDLSLASRTEGGPQMAFITEEGDHFVGELALLQSRVQWTLLDRSRVEDPSARLLFLAALSQLADGMRGTQTFRVVTGLPVKWYGDRGKVVDQWVGKHVLRSVNGRHSVHRLAISDLCVVPQPFGSLFDVLLDSSGQIVEPDLARGRLGVIDVGTYTTDYVLVDGLRYVERGSGTILTAMSTAHELIGRSLLDSYGLDLRMHEVDRAVRRGAVTVFGKEQRIDWLIEPILDAVSVEILAHAGTLWGDGRDLEAILVTGGGAMILGERVRDRYGHARLVPDAALANVSGFCKYGRRRWKSENRPGGGHERCVARHHGGLRPPPAVSTAPGAGRRSDRLVGLLCSPAAQRGDPPRAVGSPDLSPRRAQLSSDRGPGPGRGAGCSVLEYWGAVIARPICSRSNLRLDVVVRPYLRFCESNLKSCSYGRYRYS